MHEKGHLMSPPSCNGNSPDSGAVVYLDETDAPVRYFPVTLQEEVVGYLWAAETGNGVSFLRSMASALPTFPAAVAWSERLDEAAAAGLAPLEVLRRWIGAPEDPEAGCIPADAEELHAPDLRTLEQRTNPGFVEPVSDEDEDEDEDEVPAEARMDRSEAWEDLSPFTLERPGYPFLTDAAVRYLPVVHGRTVLGYLWASETEDAAFFVKRTDAGVDGTYAEGKWITRLREAEKSGLSPLQALRHWVGRPEDFVAGGIPADAVEQVAPNLRALEKIADEPEISHWGGQP